MSEVVQTAVYTALITGILGLLGAWLTAMVVAKAAAAASVAESKENGRKIEEIKISIDGRMSQYLEVTKALATTAATLAEKEAQQVREGSAADVIAKAAENAAIVLAASVAQQRPALTASEEPITVLVGNTAEHPIPAKILSDEDDKTKTITQ